jgi:hypothetical protein
MFYCDDGLLIVEGLYMSYCVNNFRNVECLHVTYSV